MNKYKGWVSPKKITEPEDFIRKDTLSVLMLRQTTLDAIFEKCLPFAKRSEFQVHYRSLDFYCIKGKATVIFTVPTVFYNFDQAVDSASVEYHLDDVVANAEVVKPISEVQIHNPEVKDLHELLVTYFDEVSVKEIADNSFHRHPSAFGFSSTDYDKDPTEPGVIYRKAKCENIPQTDSVLHWNGSHADVVVTETRLVTVNPAKDKGVEGKYVEIPTTTYIQQDKEDDVLSKELVGSSTDNLTKVDSDMVEDSYQIINAIVEDVNFNKPNIDMIIPDRIEQLTRHYQHGNFLHVNQGKQSKENPSMVEIEDAKQWGLDITEEEDFDEWVTWQEEYNLGGYYA